MANQYIFLKLSETASLDKPFATGSTIVFLSPAYDATPDSGPKHDNSSVNLVHEKDILLTISIRRAENRIILATRQNGVWEPNPPETPLKGVFAGPGAIIRVTSTPSSFEVSFDASRTVHTYLKRINADATAVSYQIDNQRPVFSNPLIAEVFDPPRSGVFISSNPLLRAPIFDMSYAS